MTSERRFNPLAGLVVAALIPALVLGGPTLASAAPPDPAETSEAAPDPEPAKDSESGEGEGDEQPPAEAETKAEAEPEAEAEAEPEAEPASTSAAGPREVDPSNAGKRAPELFSKGRDAYALGQYEQAVDKFEAAWVLSNEPALLFNVGQAYWQWDSVEPNLEYLRRARKLFENYDALLRDSEGYDAAEVQGIIAAIDAQITAAEQAEQIRTNLQTLQALQAASPPGLDQAAIRAEQRRRTTKALTISGSLLITLGSLALAAGIAGSITRGATGFSLDQSGGGEAGKNNPNSAEDDARLRDTYLLGGQLAFGGLIAGAVLLPIGISLRVTGGVRAKRDREAGDKLTMSPGGGLLTIQF